MLLLLTVADSCHCNFKQLLCAGIFAEELTEDGTLAAAGAAHQHAGEIAVDKQLEEVGQPCGLCS